MFNILRASAVVGSIAVVLGLSARVVEAQPRELPATVVTLGGAAELHREGTPKWAPAALRAEIGEGDSARTQLGGRLTFRTASGQVLRLGSRSQIALLASPPTAEGPGPTRVRLDTGWLWVAVMPGGPPATHVEVVAGPASITIGGAGVGFRRGPDGILLVQVHHGSAVCKSSPPTAGPESRWERALSAGQQLTVPASGAPGPPTTLTVDKLEETWVRWNADQDAAGGYGGGKAQP